MIIIADKIVTTATEAPLDKHALLVRGGAIIAVGLADRIIRSHSHDRILRFDQGVLLPGLVNVHAHLELPALMSPHLQDDYAAWVLDLLKAKANLTTRDYRSAGRDNIRDLIHSGTTTVAEISTHNVSPLLLKKSGLRALVYREIISMRPGPAIAVDPLPRNTTLLHFGLSPHSPHTVSEQALAVLRDHARKRELPLSMHVAETRDELRIFQRKPSALDKLYSAVGWDRDWSPMAGSSVQYLQRLSILGPRFLAVHAVHTNTEDIAILARSRTAVAHCPRSNRFLRTGTMNLRGMFDAGIPVGLGTDSLASAPTLSLWDEMRAAYKLHRSKGITPSDILRMATVGGATALGMEGIIGTLEKGKRADCIVVPIPRKRSGDLCSDLLRETKSSIMTMVNGKVLYQQKRNE